MAFKIPQQHSLYRRLGKRMSGRDVFRDRRAWAGAKFEELRLGPVPAGRALALIAELRRMQPDVPALAEILSDVERALPNKVLRFDEAHCVRFVWFSRRVVGRWRESGQVAGLPAGLLVLCHELIVYLDPDGDDIDQTRWHLATTVCSAWTRAPKVVAPGTNVYWYSGDDPYHSTVDRLAGAALDALDPAQDAIHDAERDPYGREYIDLSLELRSPPIENDPGGRIAAMVADAGDKLTDDTRSLGDFFVRDGSVALGAADAVQWAQVRSWMDASLPLKARESQRPAGNHEHAFMVAHDRVLQVGPSGRIVHTECPPQDADAWIWWAFCVDVGTSTFYVEPFRSSDGEFDVPAFLQRAWHGDASPLRGPPRVLTVGAKALSAARRKHLSDFLEPLGIDLHAPKRGGRAVSVVRGWCEDTKSVARGLDVSTLDHVKRLASAHLAVVLGTALHPADSDYDRLAARLYYAALSTDRAGRGHDADYLSHYSQLGTVRYLDYLRQAGVAPDDEREKIESTLRMQGLATLPMARGERFIQFRVSVAGIVQPIWRQVQLHYWASLFDLHVAICDSLGFEPGTGGEFDIHLAADKNRLLTSSTQGRRETLCPNIKLREVLASPGQRARHFIYDGGWTAQIDVEDVLVLAVPVGADGRQPDPPPRCVGGTGPSIGLSGCAGAMAWDELVAAALGRRKRGSAPQDHPDGLEWPFGREPFSPEDVDFTNAAGLASEMYE